MASIPRLPDAQLDPMTRAYAGAVGAKRRMTLIGGVVLIALSIVAAIVAEVRPDTFIQNLWRFTDYIARIFTLDNGPHAGRVVSSTSRNGCGASRNGCASSWRPS